MDGDAGAVWRGVVGGDDLGGLQNQVGLDGHSFRLEWGQVGVREYEPGLAGVRAADAVLDESGLFGQHYAPGETVALLVPADIAGVGVMAQRQGDLQDDEQG